MLLQSLVLQHFRNYTQSTFQFTPETTVIIGPNTAGKSNLLEGIFLLATGKSFRAEKDRELVQFGEVVARVKGRLEVGNREWELGTRESEIGNRGKEYSSSDEDQIVLEFVVGTRDGEIITPTYSQPLVKRYLVNDIPRRRVDFSGQLSALLFTPEDLEIIIGGPSIRRRFLDDVLEQVSLEYRRAMSTYTRVLRQRNALLSLVKETGVRQEKQFAYWDELLIESGTVITQKRQELIDYINHAEKLVSPVAISYEHSKISSERLLQYQGAEVGAGVTLVGPHRDDFCIFLKEIPFRQGFAEQAEEPNGKLSDDQLRDIKLFGSRGQQRLAILQLKLLQLSYMEEQRGARPLLLLDDIFSELDASHIALVLEMIGKQQTIITTTHKEFVGSSALKNMSVIELAKS